MSEITREAFSKAMHEAVDERGRGFVYPDEWMGDEGCQYANDLGEPACIVGVALHKLGVNVLNLRQSASAREVLLNLGVNDAALVAAAQDAQQQQDYQRYWGDVIDEFDVALKVAS